jgi:heat-inducible transcriptional repressor
MEITDRKKALLEAIIKQHIKTASPVGSNLLVGRGGFKLSPATIRNEMMDLEKDGFLTHPHTSAGRIPTEKGYRFFIDNFLEDTDLNDKHKDQLKQMSKADKEHLLAVKQVAKEVATLSNGAVVVGFAPRDIYYTGLTNVFKQPEFAELDLIYNLSEVVDHLDEAVEGIFEDISQDIHILLGDDNPFGKDCSTILTKYKRDKEEGLIAILGPMRMDYAHNRALVKYTQELITNL